MVAISKSKLALHSHSSGLALSRWRGSVISPEIGVTSEIDGVLDSLMCICWWCGIGLWIDQVRDRSAAAQWLSQLESHRIFSQFASSSFQLMARVAVCLFSRAVPQHHRHGWGHRKGTAQQLTNILGSASEVGANLWSLPLLEGLSFGQATCGCMTQRCVNWENHFRFGSWTACLHRLLRVLESQNARRRKHWLRRPKLATSLLTAQPATAAPRVAFA